MGFVKHRKVKYWVLKKCQFSHALSGIVVLIDYSKLWCLKDLEWATTFGLILLEDNSHQTMVLVKNYFSYYHRGLLLSSLRRNCWSLELLRHFQRLHVLWSGLPREIVVSYLIHRSLWDFSGFSKLDNFKICIFLNQLDLLLAWLLRLERDWICKHIGSILLVRGCHFHITSLTSYD
jgi:hypothetical protein